MNRHDIQLLQRVRSYPSVTITLPTHRTAPDNRQDPIRVKNMVSQATDRLTSELGQREAAPLLARLSGLVDGIDYRHLQDGLAIFVSHDVGRMFTLPFALPERLQIDETFAIRDLVYALNRTVRYRVLALGDQPARLFLAVGDTLDEIRTGGFPMTHSRPADVARATFGATISASADRDEHDRIFFRQVDQAFGQVTAGDPLPLALVGVDRNIACFKEVTSHRAAIIATVSGSHEKTSAHDLGRLVWPAVAASLADRRREVLRELEAAAGTHHYAAAIADVRRLAHEGRGRLLVVEEGYHEAGQADEQGPAPGAEVAGAGAPADAVDEVIEAVIARGGRVEFVDDGALAAHGRIALILRY